MYLKLTKEDILSSYNTYQLEVKKKYLLDLLFHSSNLPNLDRMDIHDLLQLIQSRLEFFQDEQSSKESFACSSLVAVMR
ncbi:MAG TPA: hypothetical protein VJ824_14460 [Bacillota bacterium]|nr:hypothetical protein [Bacillota bacterium]